LLPETEELAKRVLVLPTGTAANETDIATIAEIMRTVISNGAEVTTRLADRQLAPSFAG
jgi:hypothetical protein